jgi:predicted XRE-type DNA-binding protein
MGRIGNISSDLHRPKAGSGVRSARVPKKVASHELSRSRTSAQTPRKPLVASGTKGEPDYEEFDSVWEALGFSPQEAANLEARADLMRQIEKIVKSAGWTQSIAAKRCGVSQPRVNDLLRGKIDKFSIDALVNMAASLGQKIQLTLKAA